MSLPSKEEIVRRVRNGISLREAELWLADECENAAKLLRMEEPSTITDMQKAMNSFRLILSTIKRSVVQ